MIHDAIRLIFILMSTATLFSCSKLSLLVFIKPPAAFSEEKIPEAPDYSISQNWHLWQLRDQGKGIDVFYLHPTTYIVGKGWNQDLNDKHVNWRTRVLPINYQASTFSEDCNLFIPKYRQAIFYSFVDKKDNGKKALELAYQDVRNAFFYYMNNLNNGKPFIFASHSQGSFHSQKLLAEVLRDSAVLSKLVAAYVIGWPVKESFLQDNSHIKVCSSNTQSGCIVSWNTESANPKLSIVREFSNDEPILCVNPLSWTLNNDYVERTQNKGSLQYNKVTEKDEIIIHYTFKATS